MTGGGGRRSSLLLLLPSSIVDGESFDIYMTTGGSCHLEESAKILLIGFESKARRQIRSTLTFAVDRDGFVGVPTKI